jgi:hypothetical protein
MSKTLSKVIDLAFHPSTSEQEAIAAFLAARRLSPDGVPNGIVEPKKEEPKKEQRSYNGYTYDDVDFDYDSICKNYKKWRDNINENKEPHKITLLIKDLNTDQLGLVMFGLGCIPKDIDLSYKLEIDSDGSSRFNLKITAFSSKKYELEYFQSVVKIGLNRARKQ